MASNGDVETPSTPGLDSQEHAVPVAPPDPKREALRKYAGLLLQHKVRGEISEARARTRERARWRRERLTVGG